MVLQKYEIYVIYIICEKILQTILILIIITNILKPH